MEARLRLDEGQFEAASRLPKTGSPRPMRASARSAGADFRQAREQAVFTRGIPAFLAAGLQALPAARLGLAHRGLPGPGRNLGHRLQGIAQSLGALSIDHSPAQARRLQGLAQRAVLPGLFGRREIGTGKVQPGQEDQVEGKGRCRPELGQLDFSGEEVGAGGGQFTHQAAAPAAGGAQDGDTQAPLVRWLKSARAQGGSASERKRAQLAARAAAAAAGRVTCT